MTGLTSPALVMVRLQEIEADLAIRQNDLEEKALGWFRKKRDREEERVRAFAAADGSAKEREAQAASAALMVGVEEEAAWEAARLVVRVLETRANIGMALLKSHGRA